MKRNKSDLSQQDEPIEIALVGDLSDHEGDLSEKLLGVGVGQECTLYFDSPGGSPYCGIALATLIVVRRLRATGIVTGECSSAALWPLAACRQRFVTPYSVLLFHPMKSQSDEHVSLAEAAEWARHFAQLEVEMDHMLAALLGMPDERLAAWMSPGRYVTGREFAAAGLAELIDLTSLVQQPENGAPRDNSRSVKRAKTHR